MDDDTRKRLLAADSDPEYIKLCQIWDSAVKAGKSVSAETRKYTSDIDPVINYLRIDSQKGEELLASDETEGETQMRHYCCAVNKGEQPSPETIEFFNRAFQEIQSGIELKQALRIKKKQGRKKTDAHYTFEVDVAILIEKKRADGLKWHEAFTFAEECFHKGYDTVKEYHKKHKEFARSLIQQEFDNLNRREKEEVERCYEELENYFKLYKDLEEFQKNLEADEFQKMLEIFQGNLEVDEFRDMVDTLLNICWEEKFQKILEEYKTRY